MLFFIALFTLFLLYKTKKGRVGEGFLREKGKVGEFFLKRLWEIGATWEVVREVLRVKSGKGEEGVFEQKHSDLKEKKNEEFREKSERVLREV